MLQLLQTERDENLNINFLFKPLKLTKHIKFVSKKKYKSLFSKGICK